MIDFKDNKVHCLTKVSAGGVGLAPFQVSYDYLVVAVGAITNTYVGYNTTLYFLRTCILIDSFNIPGVKEHAFFLKEIEDSRYVGIDVTIKKNLHFHFILFQTTLPK